MRSSWPPHVPGVPQGQGDWLRPSRVKTFKAPSARSLQSRVQMVPDEEAGQTDRPGASTASPLLAGHPLNGRLSIPSFLPSAPLFSQEVPEVRGFLSREKPWGPRSLQSSVVVQLQPEPPAQTLASQPTRCSFHSWSALPFVNLKPSSHVPPKQGDL